MEGYYILLDIGGTQIKGCISDKEGNIKGKIAIFDSLSNMVAEVIFGNLVHIVANFMAETSGGSLQGIGLAFPGPFDYEKGICLMREVGKYESIFGRSIEMEMKKRMASINEVPFYFLNDVTAFALGEIRLGEAMHAKKGFCICIGTGMGSAFFADGEVVTEQGDGVPENGWLYKQPYGESIADDYISVRGLAKLSKSICKMELSGQQLYELCLHGNKDALTVYKEFGNDLKEILLPVLDEFKPEMIVLGGQISNSFAFFGESLLAECQHRNIRICIDSKTSERTLQGIFARIKEQERH